jgi:crossover junction endodeoxyribonuclease RusA
MELVHRQTQGDTMSLTFTLPFPPSVNTYWRHISKGKLAGRVLISEKGRDYRDACARTLLVQRVPRGSLTGKLKVQIYALPPDRRARDLDNMLKASLDALKHCEVMRDDADIDDLHITRGPVRKEGELSVLITEIPLAATDSGDLFKGSQS